MGREPVGEPERAAAAGRHWELPESAAQAATWGQEPWNRQSAWWKDERISRLAAVVCGPQTRGAERSVSPTSVYHSLFSVLIVYEGSVTVFKTVISRVTLIKARSSATPEIARGADKTSIQGHSRSSVIVPIDAHNDFLLSLNSNLTSIFNRSWDITFSLHIHMLPLFQVELEKTAGSRWTCFGVRVPRTFDLSLIHIWRCRRIERCRSRWSPYH